MFKSTSRNSQRRLANAKVTNKPKPISQKVRKVSEGKVSRVVKLKAQGYEPRRGDPKAIEERLGLRMSAVVVERVVRSKSKP
jgi:hypothetical protein